MTRPGLGSCAALLTVVVRGFGGVMQCCAWLDAAAEEMVHLNHAQRRQLCAANVERVAEWRARMHGAVREEVRQHQCPIEQLRPRDGVSQRDELIAQAKLRCVQ